MKTVSIKYSAIFLTIVLWQNIMVKKSDITKEHQKIDLKDIGTSLIEMLLIQLGALIVSSTQKEVAALDGLRI